MTRNAAAAGQVSKSAAEIYDEFFVPALFGPWAGPLCDAVEVGPGKDVLDIACGTGATTREAAERVGPSGRVVGLDRNQGMLDVARRRAPDMEWIEGLAEALPFAGGSFDRVLCQFGLMFFDQQTKALNEMARVVRPGGRIALTVWDDVARSPAYAGIIELILEMFGQDAAAALRAPFALGDKLVLLRVLEDGGLAGAKLTTATGTARFASIREWVRTDVRGWTLGDFIDDAGFEELVKAAETRLRGFAASNGTVAFPAPAHVAVWNRKPKEHG
ncbi:methyltransferase domain-containing protein [Silicimonas algicola]|uniref:Ubiquinone/menaquinone biosynthesis C-methylase UbiE n=1 Tax=Silicimonas algicola TaxID=1826607 RepID=A0A316GFU6_9RHOB|nr:methyltransferase domain-containing protein [Silicimonas algicola]AZQ68357.1 methyltransferase domain-containing protein [Silicimonas algicola]PWK53567.1 ubiquinone/menaquinone biosynthesis C-methylase UbiE [Silicimonas algicola]